ncbi:MAG: ABC transporter substrate-binding protein [Acidimicrobiia bacterium]|nr:ABC transporter substrate-binding protein [Acidimicrobiia bacterium]
MRDPVRAARIALLVGLMVALGACGDGDPGTESDGTAESTSQVVTESTVEASGEPSVIRFSFAPDPVWDYLIDTGELARWEEENNIKMETSSTWDEFTYFAGGHGDIVSIGTQELPVLEKETSIETVSFGKYNFQRSPMMTRADTGYQTLTDIPPGSTICVPSPVQSTTFWTVAMNELHGIDYRVGGGDYELIVNDHFVNPQNLLNGDCEATQVIPEAAAPYLRSGEIVVMYDGLMPFQMVSDFEGIESDDPHVMANLFTSTEEYFDSHPREIKAFLELWQRGVDLWAENKAEIIATYPQHFSVENEEDVEFIQSFMEGDSDWFVDSVYLDEQWIEDELAILEFMVDLHPDNPNKLPEDFPVPRFEVVEP